MSEVTLYRLVDAAGAPVSAPDKYSDVYTSPVAAEADAFYLAATYGPLTVQVATVAPEWGAA